MCIWLVLLFSIVCIGIIVSKNVGIGRVQEGRPASISQRVRGRAHSDWSSENNHKKKIESALDYDKKLVFAQIKIIVEEREIKKKRRGIKNREGERETA